MTAPNETPLVERIDAYFRSGNAIPVERATIKASEWIELRDALTAQAQEIERLQAQVNMLKPREITHGENCYTWGKGHWECALREIAELREKVEWQLAAMRKAVLALAHAAEQHDLYRPPYDELSAAIDRAIEGAKP